MRDLVVGAVERSTWNYKSNRIDQARDTGAVNQGDVGDQLAAFLLDSQIEMPHSADNWTDLGRRTSLRMAQHDLHAKCLHGESGVRDLCPGQYIASKATLRSIPTLKPSKNSSFWKSTIARKTICPRKWARERICSQAVIRMIPRSMRKSAIATRSGRSAVTCRSYRTGTQSETCPQFIP